MAEGEGLRQRRGGAAQDAPDAAGGGWGEQSTEQMLQDFTQMLSSANIDKKVPGLSHAAKEIKDMLAADPYNMDLIFEMGKAYASDEQWEKVVTVVMRGWKRVTEFEDAEKRLDFLALLSQASVEEKKYRQALAVLSDVENPERDDSPLTFEILKCQVYCFNNKLKEGLNAFNRAIDGQDFDTVGQIWAACIPAIKQVGAYEMVRTTVESKASTEEQKQKMEAVSRLMDLKDAIQKQADDNAASKEQRKSWIYVAAATVMVGLLYMLWVLEHSSLTKHGLVK